MIPTTLLYLFFFFNDTATTEIYTLSLHDALPISLTRSGFFLRHSRSQASTNSGFRSRHFFWLAASRSGLFFAHSREHARARSRLPSRHAAPSVLTQGLHREVRPLRCDLCR